jgi:hypothetical protein
MGKSLRSTMRKESTTRIRDGFVSALNARCAAMTRSAPITPPEQSMRLISLVCALQREHRISGSHITHEATNVGIWVSPFVQ